MPAMIFKKRSRINASAETVFNWHAADGALERLMPPWQAYRIIKRSQGIEADAQSVIQLKFGLIPAIWEARHTDYEKNRMFRDIQVKGPFRKWVHTHRFLPAGDTACILEDEIEFQLPGASPVNTMFGSTAIRQLNQTFAYRHRVTRRDIAAHRPYTSRKRLTILISGAGGFIGSALVPFLTTGGHRVIRLVRRKPIAGTDEIFWNPAKNEINPNDLRGRNIDAVIHLAGEPIGEGRWTTGKKKSIMNSRMQGTALLSETVAELDSPPDVFISASGIGYYGHRHDDLVTEKDPSGSDFVSEVCTRWEASTRAARKRGIRTVTARIGIVLHPAGGALGRMLPVFRTGIGGRIGDGRQYMSWIGMEDIIGALYHALWDETLSGPVNVVAPHPVTNAEFTRTLGRLLSRPTFFPVPEGMIRLVFGQMGEEILLSSTRVHPSRLLNSGYVFRQPLLEQTLAELLGTV